MVFGDWVNGGEGEERRVPGSFHSLEEAFCLGGTTAQITLRVLFEQMREDGPVLERRLSQVPPLPEPTAGSYWGWFMLELVHAGAGSCWGWFMLELVHAGAGLRFQVLLLSHQVGKRGRE